MNASNAIFAEPFSHIYIERGILDHPRAEQILARFPHAHVIPVAHYKDIFCRTKQSVAVQHKSQSLILARKTGRLIYPGSPVCQHFGHSSFYYTSLCMNCPYDCQYCYLRGMYPSGNLVLFVNLEDYIHELDDLLKGGPAYLCVSYDTELCALESLHGYIHAFSGIIPSRPELTVEVRTKSDCTALLQSLHPSGQLIFAFTLSPEEIVCYEKKTPSLRARLKAVKTGLLAGHTVRLCFDPMIFVPGWEKAYERMMVTIADTLGEEGMRKILDFSVGSFRISQDYLHAIRKSTSSPVVHFPFVNRKGFYQYPPELAESMEHTMIRLLLPYAGRDRIFLWRDDA